MRNENIAFANVLRALGAVVATLAASAALVFASNNCGIGLLTFLVDVIVVPVAAISACAMPHSRSGNRILITIFILAPVAALIIGILLRALPPNGCP